MAVDSHVVSNMNSVVDRVSSGSVSIGVEETKGVVGARVDAGVSTPDPP
jgi:hypothetical protein